MVAAATGFPLKGDGRNTQGQAGSCLWFTALHSCSTLFGLTDCQPSLLFYTSHCRPQLCHTQPSSWTNTCGILNLHTNSGLTCCSDICQQPVRSRAGLGWWLTALADSSPINLSAKYRAWSCFSLPFINSVMGFARMMVHPPPQCPVHHWAADRQADWLQLVRVVRAASRCTTDVMCSDGRRHFNWMLSRSWRVSWWGCRGTKSPGKIWHKLVLISLVCFQHIKARVCKKS